MMRLVAKLSTECRSNKLNKQEIYDIMDIREQQYLEDSIFLNNKNSRLLDSIVRLEETTGDYIIILIVSVPLNIGLILFNLFF